MHIVIKKLTDHILLNSSVANTSGLYEGKSGLSLVLFEASKYLQDAGLEDVAFNLLQESLISKNRSLMLEDGLPGIGYVLLHLIKNGFVDADFDEVFNIQYEEIMNGLTHISTTKPESLPDMLSAVYFLKEARSIKSEDSRIESLITKILEATELLLAIHLFDFKDINYIYNRRFVLNKFTQYLNVIIFLSDIDLPLSLMDLYSLRYYEGIITSTYNIGRLLEKILHKKEMINYMDVVQSNKHYGLLDFYADALQPYEQINLLHLLSTDEKNEHRKEVMHKIENEWLDPDNLNKKFKWKFDYRADEIGYGFGLCRLLLLAINKGCVLV